jgi:hypothetical protein
MELLSGWKEIAEHLHLTVRTAQRWERLGLPVRRVSDSPCSPVVAIPDELELWARAQSLRPYAARDERSKYFVSRMDELRRARHKIARRTRTLRRRIEFLEKEQQNILSVIRLNLASHNEAPNPNDEKIFCRRAKKRVSAGASQVSLMIQ